MEKVVNKWNCFRFRLKNNDFDADIYLRCREFGNKIRHDIIEIRKNMIGVKKNPNCHRALELIVKLIMTNSWWRHLSDNDHKEYKRQLKRFYDRFGDDDSKHLN